MPAPIPIGWIDWSSHLAFPKRFEILRERQNQPTNQPTNQSPRDYGQVTSQWAQPGSAFLQIAISPVLVAQCPVASGQFNDWSNALSCQVRHFFPATRVLITRPLVGVRTELDWFAFLTSHLSLLFCHWHSNWEKLKIKPRALQETGCLCLGFASAQVSYCLLTGTERSGMVCETGCLCSCHQWSTASIFIWSKLFLIINFNHFVLLLQLAFPFKLVFQHSQSQVRKQTHLEFELAVIRICWYVRLLVRVGINE